MLRLAPILFLVLLASACGGDATPKQPTASPAVTTAVGASPSAVATTVPTATSVPVPRPGADTAPSGTVSGDPQIDAILSALLAGDSTKLAAMVELTRMACTRLKGVGLPPACEAVPGSPPDGTVVGAFPLTACEGEWSYDPPAALGRVIAEQPRLFAVVKLDTPQPIQGIPGFPLQDHLIVLESTAASSPPRAGIVLAVGNGRILSILRSCHQDPPETQLPASGSYQVILRGPAYR